MLVILSPLTPPQPAPPLVARHIKRLFSAQTDYICLGPLLLRGPELIVDGHSPMNFAQVTLYCVREFCRLR